MKHYLNDDCIAAIASPASSVSAIGIIRVSGTDVLSSIGKIIRPFHKKIQEKIISNQREKVESHKLFRCYFLDKDNSEIDDGMFVYLRAPNSYTGEDTVEFYMHGNPFILEKFLQNIISQKNIRLAEAGEFSFRAFRNGKIDLSQAEAVADLIHSKNQIAVSTALQALKGKVKQGIHPIRDEIFKVLARVELEIDFSDQNVPTIEYSQLKNELSAIVQKFQKISEQFLKLQPYRNGIRSVIVGAPNTGKSTLFNRILGSNRSIVSSVAGTTRDIVREQVELGEVQLLFSDTAGIRTTDDFIEREGIERSLQEVEEAQMILYVFDALSLQKLDQKSFTETKELLNSKNPRAEVIFLLNKVDSMEKSALEKLLAECISYAPVIPISAKEGFGLDHLENEIKLRFMNTEIPSETFAIINERQFKAVETAKMYLLNTIARIDKGETYPDLLALDLKNALQSIAEISGEYSSDDILNFIFSKFCIGK